MNEFTTAATRRFRKAVAATYVVVLTLAIPAMAETSTPAPETPSMQSDDKADKTLLGDMGGLRSALAPYGLTISASETSEVLGNVAGGTRTGAIYEGLTDASLQWDLRTKYDWPGVILARGFQIHGRGLTTNNVNSLITVSSIEALPSTRLFELWYEHYFNDWLRLKIGQQAADQEFLISTTAHLFINSTFGWPTLGADDLPAGGPAYPLATPALRLRVDPSEDLTVLLGVFNGNPAGTNIGNPQVVNASGTVFPLNNGVFAILEAQYNPEHSPQNGTYRLGAWYNSENFPSQRYDTGGLSLANPLSNGMPRLLNNNFSIYGVIDQPLFPGKLGDGGLSFFARAMGAPGDRNVIDFYFDTGLVYNGPFGRSSDSVGIGFAYARVGSGARGLDADTVAFAGTPYSIRTRETALEVSYQWAVSPWWQLQPDFQYIANPIPNPYTGQKIGDAAIFGLRTVITF